MKRDSENILDQPSAIFKTDSIDFDLKLVRGLGLAYLFYGVVYLIEISEFLVPLPMVFFFVPIAGALMFFRSIGKWKGAFIFLLLPILVMKDLMLNDYPNMTGVLLIITFASWTVWAWVAFFGEDKGNFKLWTFAITQTAIWLVWFVPNIYVQTSVVLLVLIGVTTYVRLNINNIEKVHHLRVGLLIQLIIVLYLTQKVSHLWVS